MRLPSGLILFLSLGVGSDLVAQDGAARQGTAATGEEQSTRRADRPELEQVQAAVQAFRRITSRDSLRPGQRAKGEAPAASRSRTSSWHGRMFEYIRNDSLDAVPHEVVQRGGDRNVHRRNQFGFTVNGPVVVPRVFDGRGSTFFTFSYEGTRERIGRSYLTTMPAVQQRSGDFSDLVDRAGRARTIYDPDSTSRNQLHDPDRHVTRSNLEFDRSPFPNNRIPDHRLDRVARNATASYPKPNTNVGPFLRNNYWNNPSERTSPDGFIARVDHNIGDLQKVTFSANISEGYKDSADFFPTAGNPGTPDRLFSNRRFELSDTVNLSPSVTYRGSFEVNSDIVDTISLQEDGSRPAELGLEGVSGTPFPQLRFGGYVGLGASSRAYLKNAFNIYNLDNELIIRDGRHTWRVVSSTRFVRFSTLELDSPSGSFSFNDRITGLPGINNTGDSFATFLLGQAWRAQATDQPHPAYIRRRSFQNAVYDQWQIRPSLTVTLRVRIDASSPRTEKFDRQSTFDPLASNPAAGRPGALVFAAHDGVGRAFQPFRVRAEPYVGVSWSPTKNRNTVVRGSLLRMYDPVTLRPGPFATQGFSARRSPISPNRQLIPAVILERGFPAMPNPLPDLRGDFANNTDVDMIPRTDAQPTLNYASLEVEHKLPRGLILRARGRTTRGRDMLVGGQIVGMNRAPVEALAYRDRLNDEGFRRTLRPFPQVQSIRMNYQYPGGKYVYDEGRLNLQKRTGDGLSFEFEYAYRNRWDDYSGPGIQDPHDRSTAWSTSRGFRPQRLSVSYTYELPFGRGKRLLAQPGPLARLFSDWSVSGFSSWLSGDPLVLEPMFNNTGGLVPYLRVDAVQGVDPRVATPGPEGWFNPEAFVDPADFSLGNVPRTHPFLRNPDYRNNDIAVTKRVVISQEQSVELLVQGFNFLNYGNWNDPDTEIGPPHARNANAGRIIGSRGGRVLQLGLRYHF